MTLSRPSTNVRRPRVHLRASSAPALLPILPPTIPPFGQLQLADLALLLAVHGPGVRLRAAAAPPPLRISITTRTSHCASLWEGTGCSTNLLHQEPAEEAVDDAVPATGG